MSEKRKGGTHHLTSATRKPEEQYAWMDRKPPRCGRCGGTAFKPLKRLRLGVRVHRCLACKASYVQFRRGIFQLISSRRATGAEGVK